VAHPSIVQPFLKISHKISKALQLLWKVILVGSVAKFLGESLIQTPLPSPLGTWLDF
jgi:hypothetical protein